MTQTQRGRWWWGLFAAMAMVALVLLVAGLDQFSLELGQPFAFEREGEESGEGVEDLEEGGGLDLDRLLRVGMILYVWFVILFVLGILIYLILSPRRWKELLRMLIRVVVFSLLVYVLIRQGVIGRLLNLQFSSAAAEDPNVPVAVPPDFMTNPPGWLVWVVALVVSLALLALIWSVLWFGWLRHRRPPGPSLEEVAEEAQAAIEELRAGADLRDTVMRCYYEMSRLLSERRGLQRPRAMTAREFERRLAAAGLPQEPVQRLTRLFERVRYGTELPQEQEEQEALDSLTAIVEAVGALP